LNGDMLGVLKHSLAPRFAADLAEVDRWKGQTDVDSKDGDEVRSSQLFS